MSTKFRILSVSDYRSTHTVRPEAEIFIRLAQAGHHVCIIGHAEAEYKARFIEEGVQFFDGHPESKNDSQFRSLLKQIVQDEGIEFVHFYNSRASVNGIRALKNQKVKILLYRGFTGNIHWYDPSIYLKYFNSRVDRIICNSSGVQDLFQSQAFFKKEKAVAILKGHDISWYANIQAGSRAEFGIADNTLLLVNVANNRKMKGIIHLMEAVNALPSDANIKLLMIGRDMDTETNLQLLAKGKNRGKVIFTGFRKDALNLVKMSDAFVLTSLWGESITKSVIEAMSMGIAPIISDIPGNRELVEQGVSGLVVPKGNGQATADAIMELYHDRVQLNRFKAAAPKHIEKNLNIEKTVEAYLSLYTDLLR